MRRFVGKLLLAFALVLFSFLGTLLALLKQEKTSYLNGISLPNGRQSVICLSDSITVYSLNPEFWPDLVNLSSEASPMDVQLMKLKELFAHNPGRVKTVLLDVSILRLSGEKRRPVTNAEREGAKFFPLYFWNRADKATLARVEQPAAMSANWIRYKCKNLVKGKRTSELIQGYLRRDAALILTHAEQERQSGLDYASMCNENLRGVNLTFWSVRILCEMIELCRRNGAEPVLVTLPLNRLILDNLTPETYATFNGLLDSLCMKYHIRRVDFLRYDLPDDCFININHLNYRGGKRITKALHSAIMCTEENAL